jgi:hypothetical protein
MNGLVLDGPPVEVGNTVGIKCVPVRKCLDQIRTQNPAGCDVRVLAEEVQGCLQRGGVKLEMSAPPLGHEALGQSTAVSDF